MRGDELVRIVEKRRRRRGQGRGAGSGHTSGRGHKGQKARGKVGLLFEGTKRKKSLVRRLPKLAGKGRMKPRARPELVKVGDLARFKKGEKVEVERLIKLGIVGERARKVGVKVVAGGSLDKVVAVGVPISAGAAKVVKKARGEVVWKKEE